MTVTPAPRSESDKWQLRRLLDRLLGLRIDLSAWYRTANRDPRLRALADRFRGVKPPRFPTVFEALVNAFACQQFSLEAGLTILNRLAAACGTSLETPANVGHAFPAPEEMIQMLPERTARDRFQPPESACASRSRGRDHPTGTEPRIAGSRI